MIYALIAYIVIALAAAGVLFNSLLKAGLATEPHPKWYKYIGTGLTAFMLGAFWCLTGPYAGIKWLIAHFKK